MIENMCCSDMYPLLLALLLDPTLVSLSRSSLVTSIWPALTATCRAVEPPH